MWRKIKNTEMANSKYLVALDAGTSSCRALLVDTNAQIIDIAQKEFTQYFPKPGWVEHDPEEIWMTQLGVFRELLQRNALQAEDILGIGITNQRETTVVWDRHTGEAICNAIVWQDRRTASICESIIDEGHEAYVRESTGLVVDAYFSGTKLKWILDNVEGARERAEAGDLCFGTVDSWLIFKMTDGKKHLTDHTNASRTLLYNIRELSWDRNILELLDIPAGLLPKVQASASDFGKFTFGNAEIPICGVAGDQQSALFGQACFEKGTAKNTYGTGCFLLMNIGDSFIPSRNGLLTTLCCNKEGGVAYALEGSVFIAGAAVQWLRDGLGIIKDSAETEELANQVEGEDDLVVVPAFTGLGAPYWNMYARGAVFGITRGTDSRHFAKATLESLAFQTRDVIDTMTEDASLVLSSLKVDGGAVTNNFLMQFQADILQIHIERPSVIETTAMGAVYLAGLNLGIWDAHDIEKNKAIEKRFSPRLSQEKSEKRYALWKKAVNRTMNWIDKDE
jgi:glycerol kinase